MDNSNSIRGSIVRDSLKAGLISSISGSSGISDIRAESLPGEGQSDANRRPEINGELLLLDRPLQRINITPTKYILESAAKCGYEPDQAISELFDNAISELRNPVDGSFPSGSEVKVDIIFGEGKNSHIYISDNAGGVSPSSFHMLITLGETTKIGRKDLGVFGVGGKKGAFALGRRVEIFSRTRGEQGVCAMFDQNWMKSPSWEIELRLCHGVPKGHTIYVISELYKAWTIRDAENLRHKLGARYGRLLEKSNGNLKLSVNGNPVVPPKEKNWIEGKLCPEPGFMPKLSERKMGSGMNVVIATIRVGLMIESSQIGEYGADIYCNDRLVSRYDKVGLLTDDNPKPHPTIARLRAIVDLEGFGEILPWNDSKNRLDQSNPLYDELAKILQDIYKPYRALISSSKYQQLTRVLGDRRKQLIESRDASEDELPPIRSSSSDEDEDEAVEKAVEKAEGRKEAPREPEDKGIVVVGSKRRKKQKPDAEGRIMVGSVVRAALVNEVAIKFNLKGRSYSSIIRAALEWICKNHPGPSKEQ